MGLIKRAGPAPPPACPVLVRWCGRPWSRCTRMAAAANSGSPERSASTSRRCSASVACGRPGLGQCEAAHAVERRAGRVEQPQRPRRSRWRRRSARAAPRRGRRSGPGRPRRAPRLERPGWRRARRTARASATGASRRIASVSSAVRMKRLSRTSAARIGATKLPCCGNTSTSPSSASRAIASLTGARETPSSSAISSLRSGAPGRQRQLADTSAQRAVDPFGLGSFAQIDGGGHRVGHQITSR